MIVKKRNAGSLKSVVGMLFCFALIASSVLFPAEKASAQEHDDKLVIMAPIQQQHRLLEDLLSAYVEETGHDAKIWQHRSSWANSTDLALRGGKGTDMILTSRLDWQYRADDKDQNTFDYAPLAKQRVYRGENPVGAVEYGVIFPEDNPSPLVGDFLSFIKGAGRPILAQPDPHHFVPIDSPTPRFEPSEYHKTPVWEDEKPMFWHGMCHVGYRRLNKTQIAEMKKLWMQGYNQILGAISSEPILEFAEKHGMMIVGALPSLESEDKKSSEHPMVAKVRKASENPVTCGLFYQNEDHLARMFRPLYRRAHRMNIGEDISDNAAEMVEKAKVGFSDWLQRKHGDLETLNQKWDSSYDAWEEVGLPELPLDWVEQVCKKTGYDVNKIRADWPRTWIYKLFHEPLRYHAWAKYPRLLDFTRYMREVWSRKYQALTGDENLWVKTDYTNHANDFQPYLKPREGEEVPAFVYTTKSRPNPYLFREVPEFNAMSYDHPACKVPPHYSQVPVDVQQTAQDKPAWNSEHHLYNHDKSTPARVRFHLLQTFVSGQFKSSSYNRARTTEEERRSEHIMATRTRHQINQAEEALRAFRKARANADIAVLYTEGNRAWNTLPESPDRPELGGAIKAYGYVGALGKQWKYVMNRDVSEKHVTGTLIVDAPWLLPETVEKINALPEDREVIAVGEIPTENEYGQSLPQEALDTLRNRATVIENWDALSDVIEPAEGLPSVYKNVSKAKFYWWSGCHGRDSYMMPVPELEVRRARDGHTLYVAVLNHSDYSRHKAPIPWAAGRKVHEYTRHDDAETEIDDTGSVGDIGPRVYGDGEKTNFITEDVRIYKLTPVE